MTKWDTRRGVNQAKAIANDVNVLVLEFGARTLFNNDSIVLLNYAMHFASESVDNIATLGLCMVWGSVGPHTHRGTVGPVKRCPAEIFRFLPRFVQTLYIHTHHTCTLHVTPFLTNRPLGFGMPPIFQLHTEPQSWYQNHLSATSSPPPPPSFHYHHMNVRL